MWPSGDPQFDMPALYDSVRTSQNTVAVYYKTHIKKAQLSLSTLWWHIG